MWKAIAGGYQIVARDLVWLVCSSAGPEVKGRVGLPRAGGNLEKLKKTGI